MLRPNSFKQKGLSLIELMLSITLGLFLVLGLSTFMVNNMNFNATATRTVRLNDEMRAVMDFMANDIRRAGYWGAASSAIGSTAVNPFSTINTGTGCLLYSYDYDQNGSLTQTNSITDERFGFLLNTSNGSILMRDPTSLNAPSCSSSGIAAAISGKDWIPITDPNEISVDALNFTVVSTPSSTNLHVQIRTVQVIFSASLKKDSSVKQTLRETIAIRNDNYV